MNEIKCKVKLKRWLKRKDDGWCMGSFEVVEGDLVTDPIYGTALIMGQIELDPHATIQKMIVKAMPPKKGYNTSYSLVDMDLSLDLENEEEIKTFLLDIVSPTQLKNMLEIYSTPKNIIKAIDSDPNSLMQVTDLGEARIQTIVTRYNKNKATAGVRGKLSAFMPEWMLRKVLLKWKGMAAVKKVTEDPYCLMELPGIGFKRADEVYLRMGRDPKDPIRIKKLIIDCLEDAVSNGNSWVTRQELWRSIVEKVPGLEASTVRYAMSGMSKELVSSADEQRIGLRTQSDIEKEICRHLIRLMRAKPQAKIDDLNASITETEARIKLETGKDFAFSDEQKSASHLMANNNVFLLTGKAGTGKTSVSRVLTDGFQNKGYHVIGAALSGKAASILAQGAKINAATIHRTLSFGSMPDPNNPENTIMGFRHNEKNPIHAQTFILDEFSMVDTWIFLCFLRAIPTGSRLILMGDTKQLRAIGVPAMQAIIQSGVVPTIDLQKVHRQAEKSGVIVHAGIIREKKSPMTRDPWKTHGELQDLTYVNVGSDNEISAVAIRAFKKRITESPINEVQIITQTRHMVESMNKSCQEVYNPADILKKEIVIGYEKKQTLREGDKVLCIKNNYSAVNLATKEEEGVFNGNTGIIKKIIFENGAATKQKTKTMHIDFDGMGMFEIGESDFATLQLGYAVTVHKSQGSGFNHVICALPFHYTLNSLNLFYTAMTRTRLTCDMIMQKSVMDKGVRKEESELCNTFLVTYLRYAAENYTKEQVEKISK